MKKPNYLLVNIVCFMLLCFYASPVLSQARRAQADTAASAKELIRTAADLKTGNSQDVLASFFRLGFKDLKDGRHFQFNSSLFAIKAKADSTLWIDNRYKQQRFARNFVMGIDLQADSSFQFKSAGLNLQYAIINNRDKDLFAFAPGKDLVNLNTNISHMFADALQLYIREHSSITQSERDLIVNYGPFHNKNAKTSRKDVPKRYLEILDSLLKENRYASLSGFDIETLRDSLNSIYQVAAGLMSKRSLWTVGGGVYTEKGSFVSRANLNTQYLKGITNNKSSMGLELDLKADLKIYDSTIVNQVYHRKVLAASAGINWIIYKSRITQKSYVEFKPALAYHNVLNGQYTDENKSQFTGEGILRFRITDDLWLPIEVKYDPDQGKFFGFLNITANFDWLKGKSNH